MKKSLFFFFLFNSIVAFGQFKEPGFGKIDPSELKMTKYEKDSTADALFLFDNGESKFILNRDRHFQFVFSRHFRIKIFKKTAFHWADVKLNLYKSNSGKEQLRDIKAVTYNMVDGKLVTSKVERNNIFDEESKNFMTKKLAFKDVREGSIIELSYSIVSDFLYELRGWNFQYYIPALWSQYSYSIPEYFNYKVHSKGYLPFNVNNQSNHFEKFTVHYDSEITPGTGGGRVSAQNSDIEVKTLDVTLATKDVPAFISEPNIDCEENYMQSFGFELGSTDFPGEMHKDFSQTWASVNKQLVDDDEFGQALKAKSFVNDTVKKLCKNISTDLEKATTIYNYVQKRMKWNGVYSLWAKRGLKTPFTERSGNSAEINLLLTTMFQTAGLKADPVIFSTRDNGYEIDYYPTLTKYNSVLTQLEVDGKQILLDVSNEFCPFGTLPANDVNGKGRLVNNLEGDWVNLDTQTKYKESKKYVLEIHPDGKFTGTVDGIYDGYACINYRKRLSQEKSNEDFVRKMQENIKGLSIKSFNVKNVKRADENLIDSIVVEITDHADILGDKILFQPLLFERIEKNRYTLEDRKYPVNFNYPISETYVFEYTIPQGYEVETLPQSKIFRLQDNSISASYNVQILGNKIFVLFKRDINKILFLPEEYPNLKEMFNQIVKKHSEQIILKKKS